MTTCPRCGQACLPGTLDCPRCGTRLAQIMPGTGPTDAGVPDWLRQPQSSQLDPGQFPNGMPNPQGFGQPGMPVAGGGPLGGAGAAPARFSAESLISDDALPDWLRGAGAGSSFAASPPASAPLPSNGWGAPPVNAAAPARPAPAGPPPASGGLPLGTSANAFFDESALPDWLKQAATGDLGQSRVPQPPAYGQQGYGQQGYGQQNGGFAGYQPAPAPGYALPQPAPTPSAFPSIENAGAYGSAAQGGGMSAASLMDPNALPSWLGGGQAQPAPGANGASGSGMSARSLVDDAALPQWLRAEPQTAVSPAVSPAPSVAAANPWGAIPAAEEPLPTWLNQVYAEANVPRTGPVQPAAPWAGGMGTTAAAGNGAAWGAPMRAQVSGALSAGSLMEESALPDWLKAQGGTPATGGITSAAAGTPPMSQISPQQRAIPQYVSGNGHLESGRVDAGPDASGGMFAASDLIDPGAVPSWVRNQEPPPQASFSSTLGWTSRQPAVSGQNLASDSLRTGDSGMLGSGTLERGGKSEALQGNFGSAALGSGPLMDEANLPVWMRPDQQGSDRLEAPSGRQRPHDDGWDDYRADGGWGGSRANAGSSELYQSDSLNGSASRRRGPPIPNEELPTWLRSAGAARAGETSGRGRGGNAAYDGYAQEPYGQEQQRWPQERAQGQEWADWDEAQYAEGYDDEFEDDYTRHGNKRGWRRFFGRR